MDQKKFRIWTLFTQWVCQIWDLLGTTKGFCIAVLVFQEALMMLEYFIEYHYMRRFIRKHYTRQRNYIKRPWEHTLLGKRKSGKIFVGEKFSHFSPTNVSNSSLFLDQFLKLKGLSWVGLDFFFSEKSFSLSSGFFKLRAEECTVGVTNP